MKTFELVPGFTPESHPINPVTANPSSVVHLVTSTEAVAAEPLSFVFTNGHADMAFSRFYDDLRDLDQVDWAIMGERYWNDTPEDGDRKRRRQAEFLIHTSLPWRLVAEIGDVPQRGRRGGRRARGCRAPAACRRTARLVLLKGWSNVMIEHVSGNLLEAEVEALVNTVNTVGVMGKGIALQFRQAYPENYEAYRKACQRGEVEPGRMFMYRTGKLTSPRFIINFPTKRHWKGKAKLADVEAGLVDLIKVVREEGIMSIAVPPLGCGNGGLDWDVVRPLIEAAFEPLPEVRVLLYAPDGAPDPDKMKVATKRPNMTPGRAAILGLLENYSIPGYRLTMLEVQKLAYFLQVTGEPLKLSFAKAPYGPYTETLHHVLQKMEGHFIRGYGDRSRDASVTVTKDALADARAYLERHPETKERLERVAELIEGFETPYGMELLATTHWVVYENPEIKDNLCAAIAAVQDWSDHKRVTFKPDHIESAWRRLRDGGWL